MHDPRHAEQPAELAEIARRLHDERPTLSALELDQLKLQVERRAARPKNTFLSNQRRALMKSRMAITSMLVLGVLVSGTGTGLAVSGVSDSGSAGKAQYPPTAPAGQQGAGGQGGVPEGPDVLGRQEGGGPAGGPDVAGAQEGGEQRGGVQAARQVGAQGGSSLPFTGFAAIPLILLGLALLVTGVTLRRRLPGSD